MVSSLYIISFTILEPPPLKYSSIQPLPESRKSTTAGVPITTIYQTSTQALLTHTIPQPSNVPIASPPILGTFSSLTMNMPSSVLQPSAKPTVSSPKVLSSARSLTSSIIPSLAASPTISMAPSVLEPSENPSSTKVVFPSSTLSAHPNSSPGAEATATGLAASQSTSIVLPSSVTSPNRRAAITGLVAGAVLFLAILIAVLFVFTKRRKRREDDDFLSCIGESGHFKHGSSGSMNIAKTVIETRGDLASPPEKSLVGTTTEITELGGRNGHQWNEQHRNQIIAMAEKRKIAILAERKLLAVNNFMQLGRLRSKTAAIPRKLKSSLSKKGDGEAQVTYDRQRPPTRPHRASTLSLFQIAPVEDRNESEFVLRSPIIEASRTSSQYSRSEIWDDSLSTISEVSHAIQNEMATEDGLLSGRSSLARRISHLVIPRHTLRPEEGNSEIKPSQLPDNSDGSAAADGSNSTENDSIDSGNFQEKNISCPVFMPGIPPLEIPPRNPARLTRSSSLRSARTRSLASVTGYSDCHVI